MSHITGWMYNCDLCNRHFPIWMVSDEEWAKAEFDALADPPIDVCKQCFEDVCGKPNYLTAEEYVHDLTVIWGIARDETDAATFDKVRAKMLAELLEVWNTPDETDAHRICRKTAEYTKKACLVGDEQQRREKKFVEFVEAYPPMGGLNEHSLRPLMEEKDTEVRDRVIVSIGNILESRRDPVTGRYTKTPTDKDVKKYIKQEKENLYDEPEPIPLPAGVYNVILADPPWRYDFSVTDNRKIENQYPTMEVEDICAIHVPAADDAVLFLWATAPKLQEAFQVMESWGFEYKTHAVWCKDKIGMGYYWRSQHELLLTGVKGSGMVPLASTRQSSVFKGARTEHSRKPDVVYEILETLYPDHKYLEMFARRQYNKKWEVWGNESPKTP